MGRAFTRIVGLAMIVFHLVSLHPAHAEGISPGCNFFSTPRSFSFGMLGGFASGLSFNTGDRITIQVQTAGVISIYFAGNAVATTIRTPTTVSFQVPFTGIPLNVTWIATNPAFQMVISCLPGATYPTPPTRIQLTSLCSPEPSEIRRWRVRNPFPYTVTVTWRVYGFPQNGSLTLPAAPVGGFSEAFFDTQTVSGPNTVQLFYAGQQVDVKASSTCRQ